MAYNKSSYYGDSLGILESQVGLVLKTNTGTQSMASTVDGRKILKAGTLFDDSADKYDEASPKAVSYEAVDSPAADKYTEYNTSSGDNPKALNLFERSGSGTTESPYTYAQTSDTSVNNEHTYYSKTAGDNPLAKGWYTRSGSGTNESPYTYSAANTSYVASGTDYFVQIAGESPKDLGLFERSGSGTTESPYTYSASTDTSVDTAKTYYAKTHVKTGMVGVVFEDYDLTDYPEGFPISIVVQGRLKAARVASEVTAKKSDLEAQGLFLISY